MDLFFRLNRFCSSRANAYFFLNLAWFTGLFSGASFYAAGDASVSLMRVAASGCVSIVGLLSVYLLPLLFSAFAVYICQSWLLIPICFIKAFFFSYLAMGVFAAFGSAGWLVWMLLMFSDTASLPVLWWFWIRSFSGGHCVLLRNCTAAVLIFAVIGGFDYCMVSPFLANLLTR